MANIFIFESGSSGRHKRKYHLVLTGYSSTQNFILMGLTLAANQFSIGSLGLIDSDTFEAISASFTNQIFTGSNDSSFTAIQDGGDPNAVKVSGVAEGSGTVSFSATASYTDKFGNSKTKDLSGSVDVTITAVQQEQNVSLVINFGEPQLQ